MLAAATTGIQVGAAIVATRFVVGEVTPVPLAFMRYAIGFCCLVPALAWSARVRFARRDLAPIVLLGILQFAVVITLINYALQFISSARAALIFATFPVLTMVIAAALGQERLTRSKSVGVLLSTVGVAFAVGDKAWQGSASAGESWGALAVLGSALCGALCSVLYRPYLRRYPALPVSALAMLASVIFLALFAAREGFFDQAPHLSATGAAAVVFIGASSGVGYFLWLWALGRATPTRVTMFLALSPITAAALGALLLDEAITRGTLIGLGCVVFGLWLALRQTPSG